MNRILRRLRRDPLRKYDLKPGEPFGVSGSWVIAPDGMSLLPAPPPADHARSTVMNRSDRKLWAQTRTLADLGELTAQWLEGRIASVPGYCGSPADETASLAPVLDRARDPSPIPDSHPRSSW